jgi:HPt (histidine-containing phosphotransfer) domain-containing protein
MSMQHIDLSNLEHLFKGNQSRMDEWMRLYMQEAPAYFKQLSESLATGEAETLAAAAHDLRPQAHYLGSARMLELLVAIEDHARNKGTADCSELLSALFAVRDAIDDELRTVLKGSGDDHQNR